MITMMMMMRLLLLLMMMIKKRTHPPMTAMVLLLIACCAMASTVPLHPRATLATDKMYSRIIDQPTTNAKNSPLAT